MSLLRRTLLSNTSLEQRNTGTLAPLGSLYLSGPLVSGVATSGSILGATPGSSIVDNIPGIDIVSAARTYSGTPTLSGDYIDGLVETTADGMISKKNLISVGAAPGTVDFVLNTSTFYNDAPPEASIANVVCTPVRDDYIITCTFTGASVGKFESSGLRIRNLNFFTLADVGTSYPVTVRVQGPGGVDKSLDFTMTCQSRTISGLVEKWRADSGITMDGSNLVASWVGSVAGWTWVQATGTAKPTFTTAVQGGKSGLVFDGTTDFMTSLDAGLISFLNAADKAFTIIGVVMSSSISGSRDIFSIAGNLPSANNPIFEWRYNSATDTQVVRGDDTHAGGIATPVAPVPAGVISTFQIPFVASNGSSVLYGRDGYYGTMPTGSDGAATGVAAALGARAGSSNISKLAGTICELRLYSRQLTTLELDTITAELGEYYGITVNAPARINPLDTSKFALAYNEDFENRNFLNPTFATDYTTPTGILPHFNNGAIATGSSFDQTSDCWVMDPRYAAYAANGYDPLQVSDSCLKISNVPKTSLPAAVQALLGDPTGVAFPTASQYTWAGLSAMSSMGFFAQQYGYFEIRVKLPVARVGDWPAFWLLADHDAWPPEIDAYEIFGSNRALASTLHVRPYYPLPKTQLGASKDLGDLSTEFHVFGVNWQPDKIEYYCDRKLAMTQEAINGVRGVAINNAGTGIVADNSTANGTLAIKTNNGITFNATATVTITAGVATAITLTASGVGGNANWGAGPVWVKNVGTALPGGLTITSTSGGDPLVPQEFHIPMHWIVNFALGQITGVADPAIFPREKLVDYIRVYKVVNTPPTLLTGTQAETTTLVNAMTAASATPSGPRQTKINNLIIALKSWELRKDRYPTGGNYNYDQTAQSLWKALDALYILAGDVEAQCLINWKNPGTNDLTKVGAPTWNSITGYSFSGASGQYLTTGIDLTATAQFKSTDFCVGVRISAITTDVTSRSIFGAGTNLRMQSTSTSSLLKCNSGNATAGDRRNLAITPGFTTMTRTNNFAVSLFTDLKLAYAGYVSSNLVNLPLSSEKLILGGDTTTSGGTPMSANVFYVGRALHTDEHLKLKELIETYLT